MTVLFFKKNKLHWQNHIHPDSRTSSRLSFEVTSVRRFLVVYFIQVTFVTRQPEYVYQGECKMQMNEFKCLRNIKSEYVNIGI